ncbi:MAG: hypothetical protein CRN43_05215, partial [Candidatus Nephrothrix sp. EaCA]
KPSLTNTAIRKKHKRRKNIKPDWGNKRGACKFSLSCSLLSINPQTSSEFFEESEVLQVEGLHFFDSDLSAGCFREDSGDCNQLIFNDKI